MTMTRRDLLKRIGIGAAGAASLALVPYLPKGDPDPALEEAAVPAIIVPPSLVMPPSAPSGLAQRTTALGERITMTGADVYMNGVLIGHASEAVLRLENEYVDATMFNDRNMTYLVGPKRTTVELTMTSYPFYGSARVSGYEA